MKDDSCPVTRYVRVDGKYVEDKMSQEKEFWMVWVEGSRGPRTKHETRQSASAEAHRLAAKEKRSAWVLKTCEISRYAAPVAKPPENLAGFVWDVANISTDLVETTMPINTSAYSLETQARSLFAPHLDLLTFVSPAYAEALQGLRADLRPFVNRLQNIEVPETKVRINGKTITIPNELKKHAQEVNQSRFLNNLESLIPTKMEQFRAKLLKANALNSPALWLLPELYVKAVSLGEQASDLGGMCLGGSLGHHSEKKLRAVLGSVLYSEMEKLSGKFQLPVEGVLIALIDEVIAPPKLSDTWKEKNLI